jgi:4-hydroxythreonine-4-phosphate dehydrogenase
MPSIFNEPICSLIMKKSQSMLHIGITMGCPVGIGPEIILKYFAAKVRNQDFAPVVLGDRAVLERCCRELRIDGLCSPWRPGDSIPEDRIPVMEVSCLKADSLQWGRPNRETGWAMADYITSAVSLIQEGLLDGMATCPISKKSLQDAGYTFPGHTEMLAHLTGNSIPVMMMAGPRLRITLVTIHCSLAAVPAQIGHAAVLRLIRITHQALMTDFNIKTPRIAVAGLNPHAGEQGLFGNEEKLQITPAIEDARRQGIEAQGPFPPDTVFLKAAAGDYDAVVCMYHDQGLIPFKLLHFNDGVNVTLGLPIVRTSVDHGTAYDIAGQGQADPQSLTAAVELAAIIARNRLDKDASADGIRP